MLNFFSWSLTFVFISAYPDVVEKPITQDHEFVLLACDGIWDVLTNQEVVDFVRARIAQRMEPDVVNIEDTCFLSYFFLFFMAFFDLSLSPLNHDNIEMFLSAITERFVFL